MAADERGRPLVHWALSSLMVAEERITTKFAGLVLAHGSEEEATFLATQQVDEARHMQFYARFQDEVIADPAAIADHVARPREQLSPAPVRRDASLADEVRAALGALLPAVSDSLTPPDRDGTDGEALGASAQEIREFALDGLTRRLKMIGAELS